MAPLAIEPWLRLALAPEVGPVLGHRLLKTLGSADAVWQAGRGRLLEIEGLGPARVNKLLDPALRDVARRELELAVEVGARVLSLDDDEYPPLLRRLEYPPLVLWLRGRILATDVLAVALVGPRSPSGYARLMTGALAPALAAHGLTIVSGLAHGIDADAHRAAIDAGGRTLAVIGQGLATPIYPALNAELAQRIVDEDRGAIISIVPLRTDPNPGLFPPRNEIIAGLSLGTLIIEAGPTSGSLITARHAAAGARVVMACPGDATRRAAQGSNRLIADGAFLIQTTEDVLAALTQDLRRERENLGFENEAANVDAPPGATSATPVPPACVDELGRRIQEMLEEEPQPADAILDRCLENGHTGPAVLDRLLRLEMDGFVRQMPGRVYALAAPARRMG